MRKALVAVALVLATACNAPAADAQQPLATKTGPVLVTTFAKGLVKPWGMTFLPDGRLLVTEKPGRLRIVAKDGTLSEPLGGVPSVVAKGQGGLLDVALDPKFAENHIVYIGYSEAGEGGAGTAIARARLDGDKLSGLKVIWRQTPKVSGDGHFAGRMAFAPDGTLFITSGERQKMTPAQDLSSNLGKVVRINPDGSIPRDNPFVGKSDARADIWSYGHRNPLGIALHPRTQQLWIHEMGPEGGDELNIPQPGRNFGWPLVSWGDHYDGRAIPEHDARSEFVAPIRHWNPVISPSGLIFYTGKLFPRWRGNMLIGGLSSEALIRLTLDGNRVTDEERLDMGERIRDVEQGPDGSVYLLTDSNDGRVLRLQPAQS